MESPLRLPVADTVFAGAMRAEAVPPGACVRIMTGAPVPQPCDAILEKESAAFCAGEGEDDAGYLEARRPVQPGANYETQGEYMRRGSLIFKAGTRLGPAVLGVLASQGLETAACALREPRIALLCTGDEITRPGLPLGPGKIYNSNETALNARLRELGFEPEVLEAEGDDAEKVAALITREAPRRDIIISTGAVSVGEADIFHEVYRILGAEALFRGQSSRPGHAVLAGVYNGVILLSLSGNPFAASVGLELLARPVLAKMSRRPEIMPEWVGAVITEHFANPKGKRRFLRAILEENGTGRVVRFPPTTHSSGDLYSSALCNCLVNVPAGCYEFRPGQRAGTLLLRPFQAT
jgi:molybdopterin molybdotransferase